MEWWQVILTSTVVAGVVSSGVALKVAKNESRDRQVQLAFEREKWEHEKAADNRQDARAACKRALELLDTMCVRVMETKNHEHIWKDDTSNDEVRRQVGEAYDEVGTTTRAMPSLLTSLASVPTDIDVLEVTRELVNAHQSYGQYMLSAFQNQHDNDLYREFMLRQQNTALGLNAMLKDIG